MAPEGCTSKTLIDTLTTNLSDLHTDVADLHTDVADIHTDVGSVYTVANAVKSHLQAGHFVAPDLAAGTMVTAGGSAWTLGDASGTIFTTPGNIVLCKALIYDISAPGDYQINLYWGGTNVACREVFSKEDVTHDNWVEILLQSTVIEAAQAITAKLASLAGAAETCKVKLTYTY